MTTMLEQVDTAQGQDERQGVEAVTLAKIVDGAAELPLAGGGVARIKPGDRVLAERDSDGMEEGEVVEVAANGAFIHWDDTRCSNQREVTGVAWCAIWLPLCG